MSPAASVTSSPTRHQPTTSSSTTQGKQLTARERDALLANLELERKYLLFIFKHYFFFLSIPLSSLESNH